MRYEGLRPPARLFARKQQDRWLPAGRIGDQQFFLDLDAWFALQTNALASIPVFLRFAKSFHRRRQTVRGNS